MADDSTGECRYSSCSGEEFSWFYHLLGMYFSCFDRPILSLEFACTHMTLGEILTDGAQTE